MTAADEAQARLILHRIARAGDHIDAARAEALALARRLAGTSPGPEADLALALLDQGDTAGGIRQAREALALTRPQLAALLETDSQTVQRMEMSPEARTARQPAARMIRLLRAYLDGYRPPDWPAA